MSSSLLRLGKAFFAMSKRYSEDSILFRKIYSMKVVHLKECAAAAGISTGGASQRCLALTLPDIYTCLP